MAAFAGSVSVAAVGVVNITMRLEEGKQYFVNRITFTGNTTTRMDQHISGFYDVTGKVLENLGDLSSRFDQHSRELSEAAALVDGSNKHTEAVIGDRRTALVTLINPYFIRPYIIAIDMAGGIASMDSISEWKPFTAPDNKLLEVGFMLFLFALLKARAKLTFGQIIFTLMTFHMMITHMRFLYLFFLLVPVALFA